MSEDQGQSPIDFDLSDEQIHAALATFGVPKHQRNSMVMNVVRLVTTKEFYENKRDVSNIPDYGFRTGDIVYAYDYEENTRESVRKNALNPLRSYGVLEREQPVPRSPKTYYFLTPEFRSLLDDAPFDDVVSEPELSEEVDRLTDLPYHDEPLELEPGEHAMLIAEGLGGLIPKLTAEPVLVYGAVNDDIERENVTDGKLHVEVGGESYRLPVYPDAMVLDERDDTLYLLEAVVSLNPFTANRVSSILEAFESESRRLDFVFVTLFPSETEYRQHLMSLADRSYVWLSDHPDVLRGHQKLTLPGDTDSRLELDLRHSE